MSHTPGPWEARIYGGWDAPRVWSNSGSVAILQHHESGPAEAEANASLIAVAPDLLDAIQRIAVMASRDGKDIYHDMRVIRMLAIKTALKAKGETE